MNICYVYILASKDHKHLSVKAVPDLRHGVRQHRMRISRRLGKKRVYQKVVRVEKFAGLTGAVARERELEGWSRVRLIHLVSKTNPTWKPISIRAYLGRMKQVG
ncbi:MAG: hypothetical protein WD002_07240 [Pseudomonadales bacterium]